MTVNPNQDPKEDQPGPDPSNAPPEDWTEDMDPDEMAAVVEQLQREIGNT